MKTIKAGAVAKFPPIAVKLNGAIAATKPLKILSIKFFRKNKTSNPL